MALSDAPIEHDERSEHATSRPRGPVLVALLIVLLSFAMGLATSAYENDFPVGQHPDEQTKSYQVLGVRDYNFFHPQLLLRASELSLRLRGDGVTLDRQAYGALPRPERNALLEQATMAGRWASATMAGLTAAVLAWAAWAATAAWTSRRPLPFEEGAGPWSAAAPGLVAAASAGTLVALCPTVVNAGHAFKEDSALLLGVAVWVAAAAAFVRRPTWAAAVALGLAGGLAASGKWVGAALPAASLLLVPLAAGLLVRGRRGPALGKAALAAALALAALAAVNYPALTRHDSLQTGIGKEIGHVTIGHGSLAADGLRYYLDQFRDEVGLAVGLLALFETLAAIATLVRGRPDDRRHALARLVAPATAVGFMGLILLSKIATARYILPTTALLHYVAAMGATTLAVSLAAVLTRRAVAPAWSGAVAALLALALVSPAVARRAVDARVLLGHYDADARDEAMAWVLANAPKGSRIVNEAYSMLDRVNDLDKKARRGITVENHKRVFGRKDIAGWAKDGVDYIALCDLWYGRYFKEGYDPIVGEEDYVESMRAQYRALFEGRAGELVFERRAETPRAEYADPTVLIYRISKDDGERK